MRVWGACLRLYINNIWTEHVEYLLFSKENHIDRTCRIFLILKKKKIYCIDITTYDETLSFMPMCQCAHLLMKTLIVAICRDSYK